MKVLLLNGSPREKGCTYTALSEVAKTLSECGVESEIVWTGSDAVAGCIACGACASLGHCFMEDKVCQFVEKARSADGFIFGSPVYYSAPNGSVIAFLDRAFYSGKSAFEGKPAACVVSCRRGGASSTFDFMNKFLGINSMPMVSSTYWNQVHGNTPAEVLQDTEGLQTMRNLGRNMAWLLKCIEAGSAVGVKFPEQEREFRTNFIR